MPPIYVYINRTNNRLVLKIKDGWKLEENQKIKKKKKRKNPLCFEIVEVNLVQFNLVDNQYQQKFEVYVF